MGFFDFDAEEEDCCPNLEHIRLCVIRGGQANFPQAVAAFELGIVVEYTTRS
ncbi:hypothetical protein [Streptomyces klenkii]|uniref:hypothetical protein n=1 Tax=Streptomyces klenkii TaxID=1420899 RepID=UPI0034233C2D